MPQQPGQFPTKDARNTAMSSKYMRDSQEKPTLNDRPRLSLPGSKAAPPADSQPARLPLPIAPVNKSPPALTGPGGLPRSGKLSRSHHAKMITELGQVLGIAVEALPRILCGRVPVPLRVGIHSDLAIRHPNADVDALRQWLRRWTNTDAYLVAVAAGGSRYDLDGAPSGEIAEKEAAHARDRLDRTKKKPAAG